MIDEDSILHRVVDIDERSFGYPAMVPWALWKEIVQSLHDHPTNGHRKYEKLLQAFQKAYWFEGIIKLKTTHEFVESQAAKAVVGQTIY